MMKMAKILTALACLAICQSSHIDPDSTLSCHRRVYNHTVTKKDFFGKACWDVVPILSCWGRCDSHEISDWKFPFKRSHHPVCLHDVTEQRKILLKNCDDEVEPGTEIFEFLQAVSCKCTACKSSEASCEGIRYDESKFHPHVLID